MFLCHILRRQHQTRHRGCQSVFLFDFSLWLSFFYGLCILYKRCLKEIIILVLRVFLGPSSLGWFPDTLFSLPSLTKFSIVITIIGIIIWGHYMKRLIRLYKEAVKRNKDLILIPIAGAILWFIQRISSVAFDISWIATFDSWITSYMITLLTYMILDATLGNLKFFKNHKYIFVLISFFVSTFLSESLSFHMREDICWRLWVLASVEFIIGFVVLFISTVCGLSIGANKEISKALKVEAEFSAEVAKMSEKERKDIIKLCSKALNVKNETFEFIASMKTKDAILVIKKAMQNDSSLQNDIK